MLAGNLTEDAAAEAGRRSRRKGTTNSVVVGTETLHSSKSEPERCRSQAARGLSGGSKGGDDGDDPHRDDNGRREPEEKNESANRH